MSLSYGLGQRFTHSIASSFDFTCQIQKPAISSLVSANGPSITVRLFPENLTRAPFELGCRPSPASITPALTSSSLNLAISASSFSSGILPASLSLLALIKIMNRMVFSSCDTWKLFSVGTANEGGENDKRAAFLRNACGSGSAFQPVAGFENPRHGGQADRKKYQGHRQAHADSHVGGSVKAPAKAADQIDDRVEQRHRAPRRRQHVDGIESAAEKRERRDDQHGNELQLLEILRPDADDEAEQAEGHRGQHQKRDHPERMEHDDRHEHRRRREYDQAEDDGFGRCRADVGENDFQIGHRRR